MRKVRKRDKYDDGSAGKGCYNAMHDNSVYKVQYIDVTTEKLTANIISEIMLSQVDSEGHHYQVLTEVIDKNKDASSITKVDGFIKARNGNLHKKKTTRVWKLLVVQKGGSVDCFPLKGIQKFNSVRLDENNV